MNNKQQKHVIAVAFSTSPLSRCQHRRDDDVFRLHRLVFAVSMSLSLQRDNNDNDNACCSLVDEVIIVIAQTPTPSGQWRCRGLDVSSSWTLSSLCRRRRLEVVIDTTLVDVVTMTRRWCRRRANGDVACCGHDNAIVKVTVVAL